MDVDILVSDLVSALLFNVKHVLSAAILVR